MNLVLGDVLETVYIVDEDDEDEEIRVSHADNKSKYLFYSCPNTPARQSPRSRRCYSFEVRPFRRSHMALY
jgi:hypothetical protein